MIFLVQEIDGTCGTGGGAKIVGYIEAESKDVASSLVGKPGNSWNSYELVHLLSWGELKEDESKRLGLEMGAVLGLSHKREFMRKLVTPTDEERESFLSFDEGVS